MEQKPKPGTPEFDEWLKKKAISWSNELFSNTKPDEIADLEQGVIAGPKNIEDVLPEKTIPEDIKIDKEDAKNHLKKIK